MMSKKFVLTVTEDIDGNVTMNSENSGFNAAELLGFLLLKQQDVLEQMHHPEKFERKIIKGDTVEEITEVEEAEDGQD